MGWFKKKRTYVSAGTQTLVDITAYDRSRKAVNKEAVKRYVFDKGENLSTYLLQANQTAPLYDSWEAVYEYLNKHPDRIGQLKDPAYPQDQYYPMITFMKDGQAYITHSDMLERIKKLGLNPQEINGQFSQSVGAEWGNMRLFTMHLAVSIFEGTIIETASHRGAVAYTYRYLKRLQERFDERSTQSEGKSCTQEDALVRLTNRTYKHLYYRQHDHCRIDWELLEPFDDLDYVSREKQMQSTPPIGDLPKEGITLDLPYGAYASVLLGECKFRSASMRVNMIVFSAFRPLIVIHRDTAGLYHKVICGLNQRKDVYVDSSIMDYDPQLVNPFERVDYTLNTWVVPTWYRDYYDNEDTDGFLMPIDRSLITDFSKKQKERLIQQALRVSWVHAKTVKEYRSWVQPFLQIGAFVLAVVITVKSAGTGAKLGATLIKAATSIAIGFAIDKVIDVAVKIGILSPKLATAVKLVVQFAMIAKGAGWDFSKILTAPNMMKALNASFDFMGKRNQLEMLQLQKQANEHNKHHSNRMVALKTKQEMLNLGVSTDPSLYAHMPSFTPKINLFETPEMMYARHYNFNVVGVSQGLISHLADGLKYRKADRIQQVKDIEQEIEDVLLIT